MNRLENNVLYPILGVSGVVIGCLFLYYLGKRCCEESEESKRLLEDSRENTESPERYIIFLDIDGSSTLLPGDHPQSLFSLYLYDPKRWNIDREQVIQTLFGDREKFEKVRQFFQTLSQIDSKKVEIVITTNNFKDAIKQLWAYFFRSSWDRVSLRSGFRESGSNNKINLINNYLNNDLTLQEARDLLSGKLKAIYFEDDANHLQNARMNGHRKLCIVDCSKGNWLGYRLHRDLGEINEETCVDFLRSFR